MLDAGLYHADGQIQDEVYVYGSFVQSKMYHKGVRCTDCHEPHSLNLRAPGDNVCSLDGWSNRVSGTLSFATSSGINIVRFSKDTMIAPLQRTNRSQDC